MFSLAMNMYQERISGGMDTSFLNNKFESSRSEDWNR